MKTRPASWPCEPVPHSNQQPGTRTVSLWLSQRMGQLTEIIRKPAKSMIAGLHPGHNPCWRFLLTSGCGSSYRAPIQRRSTCDPPSLSAEPSLIGQVRSVREPSIAHDKTDEVIVGCDNGPEQQQRDCAKIKTCGRSHASRFLNDLDASKPMTESRLKD